MPLLRTKHTPAFGVYADELLKIAKQFFPYSLGRYGV
jgi:hypothetical protein